MSIHVESKKDVWKAVLDFSRSDAFHTFFKEKKNAELTSSPQQ